MKATNRGSAEFVNLIQQEKNAGKVQADDDHVAAHNAEAGSVADGSVFAAMFIFAVKPTKGKAVYG
jgi:hypothetical protein